MPTTIDTSLRSAVEDFLYREARLLDERRFDEWLDLYAPDCIYWMPANELGDGLRAVSQAYDDRDTLVERCERLQHPRTYSQDPPSRTARAISNVIVDREADHLSVSSVVVLHECRRQRVQSFAARSEHRLREADGTFRIAYKRITLVSFDQVQPNINFVW